MTTYEFTPMSAYDRANVGRLISDPGCDWFTARLLRLLCVCDPERRERIRLGFPEEVAAWEAYQRSNDGQS